MTKAADCTVGLVGDFSGGRGEDPTPRFQRVDPDAFDGAMAAIGPRLRLELPFLDELEIRSRGEFHPDSLIERVPTLAHLAEARRCVGDPVALQESLTAAGVSLEPASESGAPADPETAVRAAPAEAPASPSMAESDLLDDMLGAAVDRPPPGPAEAAAGSRLLDRAIREIVADSGGVTDFSQQDRWRDAIDEAISSRLRAILHHPAFRALESSWIAAWELVRVSASGESLDVLIADAPQSGLQREIENDVKISESRLKRLIDATAPVPGQLGLDLLVTDYAFEADGRGLRQLARLTELTEAAALPVLASATGSAIEPERASEQALAAWQTIARRPGAHLIGLCAPRILMRTPYAPDSEAIEALEFDERAGPSGAYTWAGAATGVARAALRARAHTGDLAQVARFTELEGLPMHVWSEAGERRVTGPVDIVLTEARLEAFALMGLMPVTGVRGTDTARILSLRSLAGETLIGFG